MSQLPDFEQGAEERIHGLFSSLRETFFPTDPDLSRRVLGQIEAVGDSTRLESPSPDSILGRVLTEALNLILDLWSGSDDQDPKGS